MAAYRADGSPTLDLAITGLRDGPLNIWKNKCRIGKEGAGSAPFREVRLDLNSVTRPLKGRSRIDSSHEL